MKALRVTAIIAAILGAALILSFLTREGALALLLMGGLYIYFSESEKRRWAEEELERERQKHFAALMKEREALKDNPAAPASS
jgi:hypothetical protein